MNVFGKEGMMKVTNVQNNSIIMFFSVVFVVVLVIAPIDVFALCVEPDAPDCPCFINIGVWNPPSVAFIQDVAIPTVGTEESCVADGGKPYYQMVLGCNTEIAASLTAFVLALPWPWSPGLDEREAWCSETISYWHREVGIPYAGGYSTGWHINWQVHGVGTLKEWYTTEEASGGRGRWIEAEDVSYEDFELGVTAPVPGAYVAIRRYNDTTDTWIDDGNHSLMINEMWVHKDVRGNIFQVEVTLLEGNSSNKVKDTRRWDDVLSLTPQGSLAIGTDKKIYGFGIDLDSEGQPIYDPSRLHWISHQLVQMVPKIHAVIATDPDWGKWYQQLTPGLIAYAKLLRKMGEPNVVCSAPALKIDRLPDDRAIRWHFPKGHPGPVEVVIDLLDVHPLPIKGVELRWDSKFLPWNYTVEFASAGQKYSEAILPDRPQNMPASGIPSIPVPAIFSTSGSGVAVRYVRLVFHSPFTQDAILQNLRFHYEQGPIVDREDVCQYRLVGDLDDDCKVDFYDFAKMAANWLIDCRVEPKDPACIPK